MVTVSIIEPPVRNDRHLVEQLGAGPEHADAERPEHLVAGEREEVDPEVVDVDRQVRHRLAGVEHDEGTDGVGALGELARPGSRVPSTFETWVKANTLVRSVSRVSRSVRSSRPSGVTGTQRRVAPVRRHASCHGIRLAWCSISVTSTSSPGPSGNRSPCPPPPPWAPLVNA